jgi:hypothetical protein
LSRKKTEVGDLVEISTKDGLVYAMYTHSDKSMGSLLRVFAQFYPSRPHDFEVIVRTPVMLSVFFPLQGALNRGIFTIVGNFAIPEDLQRFPIFKCQGLRDPRNSRIVWWLWDGKKEWRVGDLTEAQQDLPEYQVVNDAMLIVMIERGAKKLDTNCGS